MKNFHLRFPHLFEKMFEPLDNSSFANCIEADRLWQPVLKMQRRNFISKIQATLMKYETLTMLHSKNFGTASLAKQKLNS